MLGGGGVLTFLCAFPASFFYAGAAQVGADVLPVCSLCVCCRANVSCLLLLLLYLWYVSPCPLCVSLRATQAAASVAVWLR
jgi:hypothetical protein